MKRKILLLLGTLCLFLAGGTAQALTLTNGGFEDGLNGWTVNDQPSYLPSPGYYPRATAITQVPDPLSGLPVVSILPEDGSLFGSVATNPYSPGYIDTPDPVDRIPLGIQEAQSDPLADPTRGNYSDLGAEPTISQTFTVKAGDKISGYAAFMSAEALAEDGIPKEDRAYVQIYDSLMVPVGGTETFTNPLSGAEQTYTWLQTVSETTMDNGAHEVWAGASGFVTDPTDPADKVVFLYRYTDWEYWEWIAPSDGVYTVSMGVINVENWGPDPSNANANVMSNVFDSNLNGLPDNIEFDPAIFTEQYSSFGYLDNVVHTPIPEPGTLVLLGFGLGGLAILKRRRHA